MDFDQALEHMRDLASRLPEATEGVTFDHPTFYAGKKSFAVLEEYQHSVAERNRDKATLCFKVNIEFQQMLCTDDSYFVAPYIGKHGWTCVLLEDVDSWGEVEPLMIASYRGAALKRMLKKLDETEQQGDKR